MSESCRVTEKDLLEFMFLRRIVARRDRVCLAWTPGITGGRLELEDYEDSRHGKVWPVSEYKAALKEFNRVVKSKHKVSAP